MGIWHVISAFLIAGFALYGLGIPIACASGARQRPMGISDCRCTTVGDPCHLPRCLADGLGRRPLEPRHVGRHERCGLVARMAPALGHLARWLAPRPLPPADADDLRSRLPLVPVLARVRTHAPQPGLQEPRVLGGTVRLGPVHGSTQHDPVDPDIPARRVGIRGRIGLQSLLGWALPTSDWNSLGVTAAAPLSAGMISLPLGLIVLARLWLPQSQALWVIAGAGGVLLPIFSSPFSVGSVSLMFGAAVFPAALASLWLLVQLPSWGRLAGFLAVGLGMAVTHLPEAASSRDSRCVGHPPCSCGACGSCRSPGSAFYSSRTCPGSRDCARLDCLHSLLRRDVTSDIQENTASLGLALAYPAFLASSGPTNVRILLILLVAAGIYLAFRLRMSALPVLVLGMCSVLSVGAVAAIARPSGAPLRSPGTEHPGASHC